MSKSFFSSCPRCGERSFESLRDYAHCIECLHVEDKHFDMETAYHAALRVERELDSAKVIRLPKSKKETGAAS